MAAETIAHLYRNHIAMVRRRALAIVGAKAAAEDVAQQVFLRFFEHRGRGGSERDSAAFLYQTATNLALNLLRDGRRRRELEAIHLHETTTAGAPVVETQLSLRQMLALVGEEEARIASYYYLDGMEQDEIAELLELTRRTVGRRLQRFHRQARQILGDRSGKEVKHATC